MVRSHLVSLSIQPTMEWEESDSLDTLMALLFARETGSDAPIDMAPQPLLQDMPDSKSLRQRMHLQVKSLPPKSRLRVSHVAVHAGLST